MAEAKKGRRPKAPISFRLSLNAEQKEAKAKILNHPYNFILGHAGTGKTLLACQVALDLVFTKEKDKIIITRPTVGTEDNGFLPGSLKEKMEPWMVPIKSNMHKLYDRQDNKIQKMYDEGIVELISLSHFRGRTFDNAVCIVDEFQNLTKAQLQMAIGRLGQNSIMIFCGDKGQIDLKSKNDSAIQDLAKIKDSDFVTISMLEENHRHEAVTSVLNLLNNY